MNIRYLQLGNSIFKITKIGIKPTIHRLDIIESLGMRVSYFMSLRELFNHIRELRKVFSSYRNN